MNNYLNEIIKTLSGFEGISNILGEINQELLNMNVSCQELSKGLEQINTVGFNDFLETGANISSIIGVVELLGDKILSTSISADIATTSLVMLSGAMKYLQSNPILAVVGGLLTLGTAILAFTYQESEAIKQAREFSKALDEKRNAMDETEETIKKNIESSMDSAKGAEAQSAALKVFVDNLRGLADENGYIKNFEEAQYYVDKINSDMPGTVKLTNDGKLAWLENSKTIQDNIEQLEKKAKVEAYYDGFVESLKNEAKLRADLASAQLNYNNELEKQRICKEAINSLEEKWLANGKLENPEKDALDNYYMQLETSKVHLSDYAAILESATNSYANNKKGQELWREALTASDEKIIASAILMSDEYTSIEEKGTSTWSNLAGASEDCKNRMLTASGEELSTMQLTAGALEAAMVHKALVYGLSYDEMITKLKESGVQMTAEEEKRLQKSYEAWKMSSDDIQKVQGAGLDMLKLMKVSALSEMTLSDQKMLSENVVKFADSGKEQGLQLCQKLSENLAQNNGKVDDETKKIIDIINNIDNVDPEVIAKIIKPSDSEVQDVKSQFDKIPKNMYTNWGIRGGSGEITYKFNPKYQLADGGFVPSGELFVAREAGPELVGRINGKTAVANNDQIVSGISSGVYNAVRSAMSGNGGNGNMNIHATFVMDGEVVGKQVIKYHNGVVKRTGTTPLMI